MAPEAGQRPEAPHSPSPRGGSAVSNTPRGTLTGAASSPGRWWAEPAARLGLASRPQMREGFTDWRRRKERIRAETRSRLIAECEDAREAQRLLFAARQDAVRKRRLIGVAREELILRAKERELERKEQARECPVPPSLVQQVARLHRKLRARSAAAARRSAHAAAAAGQGRPPLSPRPPPSGARAAARPHPPARRTAGSGGEGVFAYRRPPLDLALRV
eukprot:TRINITY_DN55616_c0_g1_i1.p2 TRINITY_DN55616_c0_g1~~TRINITY_DN55616_c0_g1_i1.p2  ORF type:complete len:219 (+),score=59.08 TRINITY_DN55616_c0_g1_i1:91-747(+)